MKFIITPLLLAVLAVNAHAATSTDKPNCQRKDDLAKCLQLDANQAKKLEVLMTKHRDTLDTLRDEREKKHDENQEAMKTLRDNQHKEIAALLTPSQLTTFDKMEKQRRNHRGHKMGHRDSQMRGEK